MGKEGDIAEQTGLNSVDLPNVVALLQGARSCSSRAVESLQQVFWWGAVVSRNTCSLTEESGVEKKARVPVLSVTCWLRSQSMGYRWHQTIPLWSVRFWVWFERCLAEDTSSASGKG